MNELIQGVEIWGWKHFSGWNISPVEKISWLDGLALRKTRDFFQLAPQKSFLGELTISFLEKLLKKLPFILLLILVKYLLCFKLKNWQFLAKIWNYLYQYYQQGHRYYHSIYRRYRSYTIGTLSFLCLTDSSLHYS